MAKKAAPQIEIPDDATDRDLATLVLDHPELRERVEKIKLHRFVSRELQVHIDAEIATRQEAENNAAMVRNDNEAIGRHKDRAKVVKGLGRLLDEQVHGMVDTLHRLSEIAEMHGFENGADDLRHMLPLSIADTIRSLGIDLPRGTRYRPGDRPSIAGRVSHWADGQVNGLERSIRKAHSLIARGAR